MVSWEDSSDTTGNVNEGGFILHTSENREVKLM
jgi:hypothetical protein